MLQITGYCPICEKETSFSSKSSWLRDHFLCDTCHSIPRDRALMEVLRLYYPAYSKMIIHESSPVPRGVSLKLKDQCPGYISSQFFPNVTPGTIYENWRCENLENQTFEDESIDLHITQDVMEHVMYPDKAFKEIARTLKHGGAHIFTVPLVNKDKPSAIRAYMKNGKIINLLDPVYHGNPVSSDGALVTRDWGYDIVEYIYNASGLYTNIITLENIYKGIKADYLEVLVSRKE